jgi:hypothetical protein
VVIGLEKIACRLMEKCSKANFILIWIIDVIKEVNNHFHNNFRVGFWAHPMGYTCVNLGFTTLVQQFAKQWQEKGKK